MIKADPILGENVALAGQIVTQGKTTFQYLYVPASTAAGTPMTITYDGDEETNPKAIAAATAAFGQKACVTTVAQVSAGFQWCVIEGECSALIDGTTDVAKDDFLEVINAGVAFIKDAASRAATSKAIAREAQTTNAATMTKIYLIGDTSTIAAS